MLKISAGLPDFRGESSLATWIYRIATHAAIDRLRTPQGAVQEPQDDAQEHLPADGAVPSAESSAIRGEMNACIRGFVECLPESYRSVMVLSECWRASRTRRSRRSSASASMPSRCACIAPARSCARICSPDAASIATRATIWPATAFPPPLRRRRDPAREPYPFPASPRPQQ